MKKYEFIKDHISGISKGDIKEFKDQDGQRLIEAGYCKLKQTRKPKKKKEETETPKED